MIRWLSCNIFNKHFWGDMGHTDLYGNRLWVCNWCNRWKYKSYDAKMVAKKREEIRSSIGKVAE